MSDGIKEERLYEIWMGLRPETPNLRTLSGTPIRVIHPGRRNECGGPDFQGARIRFAGEIRDGDVEIHIIPSDWFSHHHDSEAEYNGVILHVALWDDGTAARVKKENGETVPTLILSQCLRTEDFIPREPPSPPCLRNLSRQSIVEIRSKLREIGEKRLLNKASRFQSRAADAGIEQAIYEGIMEALGYSENREPFLELARKVPFSSLQELVLYEPVAIKLKIVQAVLFGMGGFLGGHPEEEYFEELQWLWTTLKGHFSVEMHPERWTTARVRPSNFPARRIAGASYILSRCAERGFLSTFSSILGDSNPKGARRGLYETLRCEDEGFWSHHYTFRDRLHKANPKLIGKDRADDIIVNVVLPAVYAGSPKPSLRDKILGMYRNYPRSAENNVTIFMQNLIFGGRKIVGTSCEQQALIEIYDDHCGRGRNCSRCPLMGSSPQTGRICHICGRMNFEGGDLCPFCGNSYIYEVTVWPPQG
ncbi:MAG: DUF2851 family protein [bacterium]